MGADNSPSGPIKVINLELWVFQCTSAMVISSKSDVSAILDDDSVVGHLHPYSTIIKIVKSELVTKDHQMAVSGVADRDCSFTMKHEY